MKHLHVLILSTFLLASFSSFGQYENDRLDKMFQLEPSKLTASSAEWVPYGTLPTTTTYKESNVKRVSIYRPEDRKLRYQLTMDTSGHILSIMKPEDDGIRHYIFNPDNDTALPLLSSFVVAYRSMDTIIKDTILLQLEHSESGDTVYTINKRRFFYYRSGKYLNGQNLKYTKRRTERNIGNKDEEYRTDYNPDSFYLCQVDKDAFYTAVLKSANYQFRPRNLTKYHLDKLYFKSEWTKATPFIRYPYRVRYTNLLGPHRVNETSDNRCGGLVPKTWYIPPTSIEVFSYNDEGLRTAVYQVTFESDDYEKYLDGTLALKDDDKTLLYIYEYEYFDK